MLELKSIYFGKGGHKDTRDIQWAANLAVTAK